MSEKLENAKRLVRLIEKVRMYDKSAAKFIASYAMAYMEDTLDAMPDIGFQPSAHNVDLLCLWTTTPQGATYWQNLHEKVGDI